MKTFFGIIGVCLCVVIGVFAEIPSLISFQGRLLSDGGEPLSTNVFIELEVYDVETGGTAIYDEYVGEVSVQDGMYAFLFGTNKMALLNALTNNQCWVEIIVNSESLSPRQRLVTSSYALMADTLDGMDSSAFATGTPLYAYTETDPVWAAEKSGYATGTPLYAFTESDPVFEGWLDTNTYVKSELDPIWESEKAGYATGTPLYAFSETDPVWIAQSTNYYDKSEIDAATWNDAQYPNALLVDGARAMTGNLDLGGRDLTNVSLIGFGEENITVGQGANSHFYGTVVGSTANGAVRGAALGCYATGSSYGVAIGYLTKGSVYGAAMGYLAMGPDNGVAIGAYANGSDNGVAMGNAARGYTAGVAAGRVANGVDYGIALGYYANAFQTNIAIGVLANAQGGSERIAIGHNITNEIDHSAAVRGTLYLDGGTGVYYRSTVGTGEWMNILSESSMIETDPVWTAASTGYYTKVESDNLFATGTPLYAYTETDPVWSSASNDYYLTTEADALFATGTPLYAYSETDPIYTNDLASGLLTTGTPVYVEVDPTAVLADGSRAMSGTLVINSGSSSDLIIDSAGTNVVLGNNASAVRNSVAIGRDAEATDAHSMFTGNAVAIGNYSRATDYGTAVGVTARAVDDSAVMGPSFGGSAFGSLANGWHSGVALGQSANASHYGVAAGPSAKALNYGTALGYQANGNQTNIAVGYLANAQGGSERIAIGHSLNNEVDNSAAIRGTLYLDGGTGVYYRSTFGSGGWVNILDGISMTETDPVWTVASTGYYTKVESDSLFATGTPLYAYTETDPMWNSVSNLYYQKSEIDATFATGTPVYVEVDPHAVLADGSRAMSGDLDMAGYVITNALVYGDGSGLTNLASAITTNFVQKTGDVMSGNLSITGSLSLSYVTNRGVGDRNMMTIEGGHDIEIGEGASGHFYGVAVGYNARGHGNGAAVGYNANGHYYSAAMGEQANAYNGGAAFGRYANSLNNGSSLGSSANGRENGLALGRDANGAFFGAAVGRYANGSKTNIAVGFYANAQGGSERVAIGHNVTNTVDDSAVIRGTLYLDGAAGIYSRATFGSGAWTAFNPATMKITVKPQAAKLAPTNTAAIDGGGNHFKLLYDAETNEYATWSGLVADDTYAGGSLYADIYYSMASAITGDVNFEVSVWAVSDEDPEDMDGTPGYDALNSLSTTVPTNAGYMDKLTISLTNRDSLAAADWFSIKLERNAVADTAEGDAEVISVRIRE